VNSPILLYSHGILTGEKNQLARQFDQQMIQVEIELERTREEVEAQL